MVSVRLFAFERFERTKANRRVGRSYPSNICVRIETDRLICRSEIERLASALTELVELYTQASLHAKLTQHNPTKPRHNNN